MKPLKMHYTNKPLISIITVVYNAFGTIEDCIKSISGQTYKNIQHVIIDGLSSDGTLEVINGLKTPNTICISEKDSGIYNAMNKGLALAEGDWALFLGADDILAYPGIIEELIPHFIHPESIYYGNSYIKTINRLYNGKVNRYSIALGNVSHQAIFYPKSIYKQKIYDESYRIFADHIYNIELYSKFGSQFVYLPKLISIYSGIGVSSNTNDEKYDRTLINVIINNFGYICGIYVWLRRTIYNTLNYNN
jgi:glycosyltransferase involved in cell wall biosynthesis